MNRLEKVQYIDQHLTDLTPAQKAECNTKIIWGADEGFKEWVETAKKRYQEQATLEELNLVLANMEGSGNNARKQVTADLAFKKIKEDQTLKDAMNYLKV